MKLISTLPRVLKRKSTKNYNTNSTHSIHGGEKSNCILSKVINKQGKNKSFLVMGAPGTGKTYHTKQLLKQCDELNIRYKVVAPTGSAAVLYEEGQTIHSYFGVKSSNISLNQILDINSKDEKLGGLGSGLSTLIDELDINGKFLLVIDEASFLDAKTINHLLKIRDKILEFHPNRDLRYLFVYDPAQLLGVKCQEFQYSLLFSEQYKDKREVINLKEVKRQSNQEFISIILSLREEPSKDNKVKLFHYLLKEDKLTDELDNSDEYIDICASRKTLNARNTIKLYHSLENNPRDIYQYQGRNNSILSLAENCPIIFRRNNKQLGLVNGDLGKVTKLTINSITCYFHRLNREVDIPIMVKTKENEDKPYNKDLEIDKVYPLQLELAYCLTSHLAQGKSLNKVQLIIEESFTNFHGGLFVGLTRHKEDLKVFCPLSSSSIAPLWDIELFHQSLFFKEDALNLLHLD